MYMCSYSTSITIIPLNLDEIQHTLSAPRKNVFLDFKIFIGLNIIYSTILLSRDDYSSCLHNQTNGVHRTITICMVSSFYLK